MTFILICAFVCALNIGLALTAGMPWLNYPLAAFWALLCLYVIAEETR